MFLIMGFVFTMVSLTNTTILYQNCKSQDFKGSVSYFKDCREIYAAKSGNHQQYMQCFEQDFKGALEVMNNCTQYKYLNKFDKNK